MERDLANPTAKETTLVCLYQPAQKPGVLQTLAAAECALRNSRDTLRNGHSLSRPDMKPCTPSLLARFPARLPRPPSLRVRSCCAQRSFCWHSLHSQSLFSSGTRTARLSALLSGFRLRAVLVLDKASSLTHSIGWCTDSPSVFRGALSYLYQYSSGSGCER